MDEQLWKNREPTEQVPAAGIAYETAASPMLQELSELGYSVRSLRDLVSQCATAKRRYESVIPILLNWLPRTTYTPLKEEIIRALSVPWARPQACRPLVIEFKESGDTQELGLRWVIGNALSVVADRSIFDDLVELVETQEFGRSREMLPLALATIKDRRAIPVLIRLLDDEDVVGHTVMALRKLKAVEALPRIRELGNHPKAWIRREVKKAVVRLESVASK